MKARILVWEVHSRAQDVVRETIERQTIQNGGRADPCKMHGSCCVHRFHQGGEEGYEYMRALVKLAMLMEDGRFVAENFMVYVDRGHGPSVWDLFDKMIEDLTVEFAHLSAKVVRPV